MKYLPALAGLLSLLACALWIAALCGPWYRIDQKDGTQQHMGLYKSYETGHEHEHGHNMLEDAMGITAAREELVQRHKHDNDDEYDRYEHGHKHQHHDKHERHHKHKHEEQKEEEHDKGKKGSKYPTLQPIIIQPTLPPENINSPTTPAPTAPGDMQFGGSGGGGFGPFGGSGGGGMRTTPGPTAMPVDDIHPEPIATPVPTSQHGHVYRQPQHRHDDEDKEEYEPMSLNQVDAGTQPETAEQGQGHEHRRKKHGTKHEITRAGEFPYDETWVMAMRILLILATIVSAIAGLLQLIMACTVGQTAYKGTWMTSPTTALVATTLITLASIHGWITFFLIISKRHDLPHHHAHYDWAHTLNLVASALSLASPLLFWYTLDRYGSYESLLGEETMAGGRRKYASVE